LGVFFGPIDRPVFSVQPTRFLTAKLKRARRYIVHTI
jgi:hypothetical protein